jgi:hypothetical protein
MKKLIIISAVLTLSFAIAILPASAENMRKHRSSGITIEFGNSHIGNSQVRNDRRSGPSRSLNMASYDRANRSRYQNQHRRNNRRGHWKRIRVWVPPQYNRVRTQGYYRSGRPIRGSWAIVMTRPGGWMTKKVWVSNHRRHRN